MALGDMKRDILNDAEAKASAIDQEAKAESDTIISEGKSRAREVLENAKKEAQRWSESFVTEHGAEIQIDRHNAVLLAKEEAIDANIGAVLRALTSKINDSYAEIVKKAVGQLNAIGAIGQGSIVVKAAERYHKQLKKVGIPVEFDQIGITIESRDGKIKVDLSPNTLMKDVMGDIRAMIADALFEEGEKAGGPKKAKAPEAKKVKKARKMTKKVKRKGKK